MATKVTINSTKCNGLVKLQRLNYDTICAIAMTQLRKMKPFMQQWLRIFRDHVFCARDPRRCEMQRVLLSCCHLLFLFQYPILNHFSWLAAQYSLLSLFYYAILTTSGVRRNFSWGGFHSVT